MLKGYKQPGIRGNYSQLNNYKSHNYTFEYLKWHKYKGIVEYKLSDGTIYKDSI